jgi:phage terminase large subunit GpA-like protein
VICQKSAQLGFTEAALNCVGTYIDISPCPILYIMPTVNMAKGFSKSRVNSMIDACPSLMKKIRPARERDANNTVLEKSFAGGILILTGANSAAELRSRPIRVLLMDEIDAYPLSVDDEGSPIALAEKRTTTFANKKIFKLSTPTVSGRSAIENEIENTDKRKFFVPFHCCGVAQTLEFKNLKWIEGDYTNVKYECEHCGELIEERFKPRFLDAGEWIATDPSKIKKDVAGYIINGLYSPLGWLSWKEIAEEYDTVKKDPVKLRTFTNTVLGESYAEKGEAPAWESLFNKRLDYKFGSVHNDVVFITAGADVQRDRIECEIVGWCENKISYSIEYVVFNGDTSNKKVWDELAMYVDKKFTKDDGSVLSIRMMAIDSGYNTNEVYTFCKRFDSSRVIPTKGQDSQVTIVRTPQLVDMKSSGKKAGKVKVWNIGVSVLKSELYGWLRQEINHETGEVPNGYCYFPQYGPEHFKGITAENLEHKIVNGHKKYSWVKKYERNEPLDCRVYARAAASVIGMDRLTPAMWKQMKGKDNVKVVTKNKKPVVQNESNETIEKVYEPLIEKKKKKRKSDYWNR